MSTRKQVGEQIAVVMQEVIASAVLTNERIARSIGLNVVDFQTYGVLLRHGEPMTPGQLAQTTELPSSTTTRVLDRLEAKGLVRRTPCPNDRRVMQLALTAEGESLCREIPFGLARVGNQLLRGFTPKEFATLKGFLRRMLENAGQS